MRSNLYKPYSLKCIIVNKNYRTILTNKWAVQSILLNNINNIRNYTTALPEDSLNSTVRDLLPYVYVERFSNLTPDVRYWIKKKYEGVAVIYLWVNKINGKSYVGKTINLKQRLNNYLDVYYLNKVKSSMPISGSILKNGIMNFELFVLEVVPFELISELPFKEAHWYSVIKSSYNVDLNFMSQTKTQFGRQVTLEARKQASEAMKGRVITPEWRKKISDSLKGRPLSESQRVKAFESSTTKKAVYCYDYDSNELLFVYEGMKYMARTAPFNISQKTIYNKIDQNKPHYCTINDIDYKLRFRSIKID